MSKQSKWTRVVILLPDEVAKEFRELCDKEFDTMSNIGRKLIAEWIEKNRPQGRPPQGG